jgi:glycosyltransferase involved in cell wall biosynthesis
MCDSLAELGRIAPQKGQSVMVDAMKRILDSVPSAKLILIGGLETPDYCKRIEQKIEQLGVRDRIQWLGLRSDVQDLFFGMDILVQPSLWESFPISMLEGMVMGLPIVATDVGGVRECIEHGRSGYLIAPNQPAAVASAIVQLFFDAAMRRRLGEEARRVVQFRFAPESQVPQIESVLKSVVKVRSTRAAA